MLLYFYSSCEWRWSRVRNDVLKFNFFLFLIWLMFYSCMSFKKDNGMKCIKIENKTVFWHVPAGNHRVLVLSPKSWPTEPNGTIIQVITITCGSWTAAPLTVSCSLVLRPYFTRKYSFCWRILSNITPVHNYDNCGKRDVIKNRVCICLHP